MMYFIFISVILHYYSMFSESIQYLTKKMSEPYILSRGLTQIKRLQRQIKKLTEEKGISTKSQQALQMQREQNKMERKKISKEQREQEKQARFLMNQKKRKDKHKGHQKIKGHSIRGYDLFTILFLINEEKHRVISVSCFQFSTNPHTLFL